MTDCNTASCKAFLIITRKIYEEISDILTFTDGGADLKITNMAVPSCIAKYVHEYLKMLFAISEAISHLVTSDKMNIRSLPLFEGSENSYGTSAVLSFEFTYSVSNNKDALLRTCIIDSDSSHLHLFYYASKVLSDLYFKKKSYLRKGGVSFNLLQTVNSALAITAVPSDGNLLRNVLVNHLEKSLLALECISERTDCDKLDSLIGYSRGLLSELSYPCDVVSLRAVIENIRFLNDVARVLQYFDRLHYEFSDLISDVCGRFLFAIPLMNLVLYRFDVSFCEFCVSVEKIYNRVMTRFLTFNLDPTFRTHIVFYDPSAKSFHTLLALNPTAFCKIFSRLISTPLSSLVYQST